MYSSCRNQPPKLTLGKAFVFAPPKMGREMADSSHIVAPAQYCEATKGIRRMKQLCTAQEKKEFRMAYESKKKTEMCRNFEMYGRCKFGNSCSYAHGVEQLQAKSNLPSNFKTKLCNQFHKEGVCMYGTRCQFLHSTYDLKSKLTYTQALNEGARLTHQRNTQISGDSTADCLWANLKTGTGCGAPKGPRLACFEEIYSKDKLKQNQKVIDEEDAAEALVRAAKNSMSFSIATSTGFSFRPAC